MFFAIASKAFSWRMGHAGDTISAFGEGAAEKVETLRDAGVAIALSPSGMGTTMAAALALTAA